MRVLALSMFLLTACGDDQPPPIDASVEHITPSDLGQSCPGGFAGCYNVMTSLGGRCQERCVSIGANWEAICTGLCTSDNDCGTGAPHCYFPTGGTSGVCTNHNPATEDPNMGCVGFDAPMPIDARID